MQGLDADNGSEFLNESLILHCASRGLEFSRSRPHHKNDQAWIEQKNGAVVRRFVGYGRLEGVAATEALGRLYRLVRLFVNFFQPSFKLKEKVRVGSRVVQRHHRPQTPYVRLLGTGVLPEAVLVRLRNIADALDPLDLVARIRRTQEQLALLSQGRRLPSQRDDDLTSFLARLSTAWQMGEVRPSREWRKETAHKLVFGVFQEEEPIG